MFSMYSLDFLCFSGKFFWGGEDGGMVDRTEYGQSASCLDQVQILALKWYQTNENHLLFTHYCSYQHMSINVLFSGNTHAARKKLRDQGFRRSQQISPLRTRYTGCPKVLSVCILSETTQRLFERRVRFGTPFYKSSSKRKVSSWYSRW